MAWDSRSDSPGKVRVQNSSSSPDRCGFGALFVAWIFVSLALQASAQVNTGRNGTPTATSASPIQAPSIHDVRVPFINHPLTLGDFAEMKPRPELRDQLAKVDAFVQNTPIDGQAATESTQVYLAYTKVELYVVFLCFDGHPSLIRRHLARRENILNDDTVTVLLDPFQDHRRGVLFQVNSLGVQADASWTETNAADYSYDQVWNSEGRVTAKGWMALIAIPFRSLRFRPDGSDWGIIFERNIPRNSEIDYWPRVAATVSGTLSQEGTLRGIAGVSGSRNLQINPYLLAQNEHTLETLDPNNPAWSTRNLEGTAGGEGKIILKGSIVLDGTVNPDFSDVESDQPQFTVNQRYPVYFPELRPFFLENASYFVTPLTLLYTRDVVRPDWGGRLTGKVGNTNFGILAIDDREPGQTVPTGDPLFGAKAKFYVGRISQDLGKGSNLGLMYTDEEFGGGWNRVGGVDLTWRANDRWSILAQMVESTTKGSQTSSQASVFPEGYRAGPATDVQITRSGHAFNLQEEYQDFSTGFDSLVGFFSTADIRNDHVHSTYQWFPKKSLVQSFGLETNQNIAFDHQNNRVYHYSTFDPFVLLPRNILLAAFGGQNSDTVGPQDGYLLKRSQNFTENLGAVVARGQPWPALSFNLQAIRSGNVNYNPPAGRVPFLMNQETIQALISVSPLRQLTNDITYLLDRDHSATGGQLVYESQTLRTKLNYQFTRSLSARVIVEYDTTLTNPLETSLARTKQVQTQALLTWLPHPGTVIYVGWNNDLQNYNHQLCMPLAGERTCDTTDPILPRGPGYLNDGRQFFLKASYLLRF